MRALLVDDERLARRELRSLLAEHADVEVIAEADCVDAAARVVNSDRPDVIFLDVQLTYESGFDLLARLENAPRVVFVTAYDRHALRAFDVNALDYLLKPVHPDRLARALDRLRDAPVTTEGARALGYDDRVWLADGAGSRFVAVREVVCVRSAGDYSEVVLEDGATVLVNRPLKSWEERLPATHFTRIHRGSIVNLAFVEGLEHTGEGCAVRLRGLADPLPMSRRYAARVRERFG